jgi:beta-lactamase superfamily II metal-dependent hydrolase
MPFALTMFSALDGDCLLLTWGTATIPHHLLVDLGRGVTYTAIRPYLASLTGLELFVVSHVDADHIAGAMPLARERKTPFHPRRIWFNGRSQLAAVQNREPIHEPFGARQGEKLSRSIVKFGWPWNSDFASEIVSTGSAEASRPLMLAGGLSLRLLSPRDSDLAALLPVWDREVARARLRFTDPDEEEIARPDFFETLGGPPDVSRLATSVYERDNAEANGSAIAFLAEFEGKRVLLAADAHSEVLEAALTSLAQEEGGACRIDLAKVSHHGSRHNTSPAFIKLIDCQRFAFSTDGSREHKHPHPETIARFLAADPERDKIFYFNYRQPQTELWDSRNLQRRWRYNCVFPSTEADDPNNGTLTIQI